MRSTNAGKGFLRLTLLAALACFVGTPAKADLVANGTFVNGTYMFNSNGFDTLTATSNAISGWTVTNGSVDVIATYWQQSPAGGYSLDMDGITPGTITQTVNTVVGTSYTLSFYLSGNPDGGPTTKILDVSASPVIGPVIPYSAYLYTLTTTGPNSNSERNMMWEKETYVFTATSTSTLITFASGDQVNNPWGPALAGVSLTPEPGFYGILALGLAGLGFAVARRRSAGRV
jgi:choice-of-anchor C domain-containing protein